MIKRSSIMFVFSFTFITFFVCMINANEIHMKDGRIVKTKTCWEENGIVYYEKYGATIGINKNLVKEIKINGIINKRVENSVGMVLSYIPPGTFYMGSFEYESGRQKGHEVTLTKGFYMQTTEVTRGQWYDVMQAGIGSRTPPKNWDLPKSKVTFGEIKEFIDKLNSLEKTTKYRLPTEAEWEY